MEQMYRLDMGSAFLTTTAFNWINQVTSIANKHRTLRYMGGTWLKTLGFLGTCKRNSVQLNRSTCSFKIRELD